MVERLVVHSGGQVESGTTSIVRRLKIVIWCGLFVVFVLFLLLVQTAGSSNTKNEIVVLIFNTELNPHFHESEIAEKYGNKYSEYIAHAREKGPTTRLDIRTLYTLPGSTIVLYTERASTRYRETFYLDWNGTFVKFKANAMVPISQ